MKPKLSPASRHAVTVHRREDIQGCTQFPDLLHGGEV